MTACTVCSADHPGTGDFCPVCFEIVSTYSAAGLRRAVQVAIDASDRPEVDRITYLLVYRKRIDLAQPRRRPQR